MSRDFEDEEHKQFIAWEWSEDGKTIVLSNAAYSLHTAGMLNALHDGHPAFVSDDYLNAITAETTLTVMELCTLGHWERTEGGYTVKDREGLDMVAKADEHVRRMNPN